MNASVLLPSRGNPEGFRRACENLSELASDQSQFEIVLMLDDDDDKRPEYSRVIDDFVRLTPRKIKHLRNWKIKGYSNLHLMFDECARNAFGDVLIAYNDDVVCETKDWDKIYAETSRKHPMEPISSQVTGDHFQWAFPAISREMSHRVNGFCFQTENFDRLWCAVAKYTPLKGVQAEVVLHHNRVDPEHGSEDRKNTIAGWVAEWEARQYLWDQIGKRVAELLK